MTPNRIARVFAVVLLFAAFPSFAFAGTTDFRVLFDTDGDASTGCTVAGMAGVEQIHLTRVSDDDTSPRVTQTHRQVCTAGALGALLDLDLSSRPAAFRAGDRQLTLETRIPFSAFGAGAPEEIRVGFDATRGSAVHTATENADGTSAIIPLRARMRATGGAGRTIVMDGSLEEWGRIAPVLFGIQDGGSQALRLVRILSHASNSDNFLYFAAVARIGSDAPFAVDDTFLREPGSSVSIVAPGVLQNDGDPLSQPLTAVRTSDPENGTVTLNADGSFTYTPTIPAYDAADEFEYKATAGSRESSVARVRIKVRTEGAGLQPVDDAYSTPEDVTLTVPAATGVLANDPPVGGAASAVLVTAPSHGTLTLNADGGFTYKPAKNFFGTDTFVYSFRVGAADFGNATVTITVTSGNDAPTVNPATFSVIENSPSGTPVGTVTFSDPDAGDNHTFSITAGNTGGAFAINPSTGLITVAGPLNYEAIPSYSLTVRVQDDGSPSKSGFATITININDDNEPPVAVNDNYSTLAGQALVVPAPGVLANDTDPDGNPLIAVNASTPANGSVVLNANGSFTYTPNGGFSGIDTFTYQASDGAQTSNVATVTIQVNQAPAITSANSTGFSAGVPTTFTVTTTGFPTPSLSQTGTLPAGATFTDNGNGTATIAWNGANGSGGVYTITITATNVAGSTPQTFTITVCNNIVITNPANATGPAGSPFSETFTQTGAVGTATFTLASGTLPAGMTLATNGTLSGTPTQNGSFPITVLVTDANGCTGTSSTYTLVITCQTITVINPANGNGTANSAFSETFTQTGGIGATTFALASGTLPTGLTLATNGVLSGTPTQTGSFPITVTATDANGCTGTSSTYTIVIGCQVISVTNPANGNGTASSAFSETFTQTGSIGTATFTLASGTLPAGLTLAANGVLSGIPTQTGSFPITVTATDSNGCTGTGATYTIVIGCQTINVTNPANTAGTASAPFSETFTQTGAIGTPVFTTASTLPAGLSLAANGVLSGTPTQTGTFPIVVTVTDANGCTGTSATYTLVIGCQTITVTNPANATGTVSATFSETFTQSGAIGTPTFTLASGVLPAGLALATNGTLSGTPTQSGSFPITVTVTDANGCTGTSATYTIIINCQTITVTNPANATGPAGSPFSETFTETGAIGTATFTLASGTLPTGLTLSTAGVLSGTPTQGGTFPITVTVTDSNGCTGTSATYNLVITCPTITVNNPANGNGTANSAFSETFTSSGGIGTMTYTLASGTLPAGLTLAANGVLSGTPTQTGSFPITVTATDANGCTGTGSTYTIVIGCQTITVNNPANANGTAGSAFSETFTESGSIGTATFTLASGTLPTGLTLAANGVLSGTPTQTGSFPITVTVTDANGCTGTSATYTIVIACQTITVNNPANGNGTANAAFSETFTHTDGIGTVTFTLASGSLPAGLTLAANGVLSGTPTQTGSFPITVTATDANGCTGTGGTYTIIIGCQTITVTNPANGNGTAGSAFSETFTQSGAIGSATFTLATGTLPAGLTLATNGVLSGTPTQTGSFPITVTVTDANGCTGTSATYTITIACQTITVNNPANATGPAGSPFSETFTETGAIGSATFTLASGTLPTGLTLAANGVLSGTPTQGGSFPITVTVTDANGCTGTSATYTIVITCPTITVNNPANANGTAGSAFGETFTQTGGQGTVTYTLDSGTLPAGLTLNPDGSITGTPTQTGSFPITVLVTDANGCTGTSGGYTIVIACQTITVNNPANANGTANSAFTETFTQTGGIGTTNFTLASGTLPAGLTLAANGVLSGTPTQTGSFPITVTATDSNGCTGTSATYTIVIGCQVITVTNPANTGGTINVAFSETFTQTGAIGSATFTTASTLPTGITLATNGVLSGTPTQVGTFPIVVTVTDANGCTGTSATYTLVIACQTITVTNPANANGTVGAVFSETFTQTGANGTATFTTASTLPAGITLSTAGVLSGTPTQAGNFPITVTVTDSNGCTGTSATYTLVIACQTITVNNPANTAGTVDAAFSETFAQTGAIGTATFTTASTLPSGLTLSTAGVLSGTPGQPGTFPIVVTVTDSNGCSGTSATYNLVIACQAITVTNPATTTGTVDAAFSQTFTQTGVGTHTPATFTTSSPLPSGLTLSAAGVLSGTPGQPGSFPITVTVTDANGCTGTSATYTLVIACQTITVTNPAVTAATYNAAFSQTFTQTGVGTHGPAVFTTSSTLPTGLTLASTGVLSGTPTQTGTFPIVVTVTDANGCTGTGPTYTLSVAPVAVADSYNNAVNNTQFVLTGGTTATPSTPSVQVAGSIATNDQPAGSVSVVPGTFATANGGSVTIAADGTFLYTPPAQPGIAPPATDTFTYTVTSNTGGTGPVTSAPATVTINLLNRVWYVKNDSAAGGDGRSHQPFDTLAEAETASTAGDYIFVYVGNGTTAGQNAGIVLKANQKLYGQGVALTVNAQLLVAAGAQPQIGHTNAAQAAVRVQNISGVEIKGLNIGHSAANDAVSITTSGGNGAGAEISDNTIRQAGAEGIDANHVGTGSMTLSIHDNVLTTTGAAINIIRAAGGGTLTITAFDDLVVTAASVGGINVQGTGGVVTFDAVFGGGIDAVSGGTSVIGSAGDRIGAAGLTLNNVAGTLNYTDLDIFTDAGAALFVDGGTGGFTFTVTPTSSTLIANAGAAASLTDVTTLDLQLAAMTSANSATNGVLLSGVTGTFTAASGSSIANATSTDFQISASNVTVTYAGTITDDLGQLITISSNTGTRTHAFTGAITDGDDGDGTGITMSSNSAGTTVRFSGGLVLSTGTAAALSASGGGVLEICDESGCNPAVAGGLINKITTTTGTALNVSSTTIGAADLEFRSISVTGNGTLPASGIILNTTGSTGNLNVRGNGGSCSSAGTCTGGAIQGTGGDAISLTSTLTPVFTRVFINNTGGQGINVTNLTAGLTIDNCAFNDTGNGDNEHAMKLLDVSGTVSVQGTSFNNTAEDFFNIDSSTNNAAMTLDVGTTAACTFTQPNTLAAIRAAGAFAGNGILVQHRNTKNYTINLSNSTFTNIKLAGLQVGSSASTSTATNVNVNLDNNDFLVTIVNTLGNPNNRANLINIQALNTLDIDASITNNVLDGGGGGGIQLGSDNSANLNAIITGNVVSDQFADGILMAVDESATLTVLIDNNNISNTSSDGMELANAISPDALNATLNATITNNTVSAYCNNAGGNAFVGGIAVFSGASAGDNTRLDMRNNNVSGSPSASFVDYWIDGTSFGDAIEMKGAGVAAVTEASFLAQPNTAGSPAGQKTFISNTFYNNNAAIPTPVLTP